MLKSGALDIDYLGKILEFALGTLQRLSSPAREEEMKVTHQKLMKELAQTCEAPDETMCSRCIAMIKGLCFVLEQIEVCFMLFLMFHDHLYCESSCAGISLIIVVKMLDSVSD